MFHGKQFSDWGTPRPASTRSSPSLNDPLEMIKRGMIKSGTKSDHTSGLAMQSKEHAIDSSSNESILQSQAYSTRDATGRVDVAPKSVVQVNEKYSSAYSGDIGSKEQIKQSGVCYQGSNKVLWATLKNNKRPDLPKSDFQMQQSNSEISHECRSQVPELYPQLQSKTSIGREDTPYSSGVTQYSIQAPQLSKGTILYENNSVESVGIAATTKQSIGPTYADFDAKYQYSSTATYQGMQCHRGSKSNAQYYSSQPPPQLASQQPSNTSTNGNSQVYRKSSSQSNVVAGKWDHVMNAKDDLIRQKDIIIERQKQTIEQMQRHINEIEDRFSQNTYILTSQRKEEQKHELDKKQSQCQIAQLKAQLQQISAAKQDEIEKLQKTLGETEYELQKLEKGFKDVGRGQAKEISELTRKIEERDVTDKNLKKSLDALQDDLKKERRKAQSLQQYLQDLPTAEEHKKSLQQVKDMKSEKLKLEEGIEHLEKLLKESKDKVKEKEKLLQEERASKEEIIKSSQRLSGIIDRYKEREKDGPVTLEEYDEVKWESERLKADCERIKKLLEQKHKKMKLLHQQSQNATKALEERLGQEEDTINTLRRDIETKDSNLEELRTSVKQVATKNQDLMSENLALKDILSELDRLTCKEVQQVHIQVHKELNVCVAEIKYLIQLCSETAEGKDPNMSALLGIKGQQDIEVAEDSEDVIGNPFSIEFGRIKLKKIRELRGEIDKLRTFVSDKYAEEVGNNCVTQ